MSRTLLAAQLLLRPRIMFLFAVCFFTVVSLDDTSAAAKSQRRIFDARDYGAVGDGIADDQPAIERAINAASIAGGGDVFLPPGTYQIRRTVHLRSNVTLLGAGMGSTIVRSGDLPDDDPSAHYTTSTQIRGVGVQDSFVKRLSVKLEGGTTESLEVGISFDEGSSNVGVFEVEATGHEKPALRVTGPASNAQFSNNYVHHTRESGTGILVDSFSGRIENVLINNNRVDNVLPDSAQGGIAVWACCAASTVDIVIRDNLITNTKDSTKYGGGPGTGIRIYHHTGAGATSRVSITGNTSTQNAGSGLNVSVHQGAVTDLVVKGNVLTGNAGGPIELFTVRAGARDSWSIGPNFVATLFLPLVLSGAIQR